MTSDEREKAVAVCDECATICTAWIAPGADAVSISPNTGCDCEESSLRVLDAQTVFGSEELRPASG
ncbi:hypothetical protein [Natrinema sp. 1APR25-10V2]|uniref:hypothetical protein n=1 Tax=Natrinema sp. 1APR25-10V2 TaxID=2951081 RepID=UPI002873FA0F|nr:hypothetical protein [Natrinema sp. 1APR25-10V2]MDS0475745.1 hypothetical protein [Natrinema sp. 1APR25-10V2]